MRLVLFLFLSFLQFQGMAQATAKLIYVGDPMCSWCYGIAPELMDLKTKMDKSIDLQLVMGGLRPYNTETMRDLGDFLSHHWEEVADRSGQVFNAAILKDMSFVYDTEPPSRAVLVVRKMKPEQEFAFFKAVQTAFYKDNKNTNEVATYLELAKEFGIDAKQFQTAFESAEMKEAVREDFNAAAQLGARSFPTIILQKGEEYFLIARGYAKSSEMLERIQKVTGN